MRENGLLNKIDSTTQYTQEYKSKMKELYHYFASEGFEFREHALNRVLGQKKSQRKREFTKEDIVSNLRRQPNFMEENSRTVKYYNGIAVIQGDDTGEVITVISLFEPKTQWRRLNNDY